MNTYKKTLITESSLSRVYKHSQEHDIGTVTGYRGEYTKKENQQRNKKLKAQLIRLGYGLTAVKGSYIEDYGTDNANEVTEEVYLVVDLKDNNKLEKDLRALGEEYDQDSILYVPKGATEGYLIGTNHSDYPGYGNKIKLKNILFGKSGEFFTRVNGRPFTLKESNEVIPPSSHLGKQALKIVANRPWNTVQL